MDTVSATLQTHEISFEWLPKSNETPLFKVAAMVRGSLYFCCPFKPITRRANCNNYVGMFNTIPKVIINGGRVYF